MTDRPAVIGGDANETRFTALFLAGVLIGTVVRTGAWLLPTGLVSTVKNRLP